MISYIGHNQLARAIALNWLAKIPTIIVGGTGVGKTDAVYQAAKKIEAQMPGFKVWKILLAMKEATDIGGFPREHKPEGGGQGVIKYIPTGELPWDTDESGIVFFDELDRSQPDVQNSVTQIFLGGELHGHKLSPNAYIMGAMNGIGDIHTTPLSDALITRSCILYLRPQVDGMKSWNEWADSNGIHPILKGFANYRHELVVNNTEYAELSKPTPRTRDMLSRLLVAMEQVSFQTDDLVLPIAAGCVGTAAAAEFRAFLEIGKELPSVKDMLADPSIVKKTVDKQPDPQRKVGVAYAICAALIGAVKGNRDAGEKAIQAISPLDAKEIMIWGVRGIEVACPDVISTPTYTEWFKKNKKFRT